MTAPTSNDVPEPVALIGEAPTLPPGSFLELPAESPGDEEMIPLPVLAEKLGLSRSTLYAWVTTGILGEDQSTIKLVASRRGKRLYSSTHLVRQFEEQLRKAEQIWLQSHATFALVRAMLVRARRANDPEAVAWLDRLYTAMLGAVESAYKPDTNETAEAA